MNKKHYATKMKDMGCYRYPIISEESGFKYEVRVSPYSLDDNRYSEGSVARLYKKGKIFKREIACYHFDNDKGKIRISFWQNEYSTDLDYNMINMTNLIVNLYEDKIKEKINNRNKLQSDFDEFKEWDGIVRNKREGNKI